MSEEQKQRPFIFVSLNGYHAIIFTDGRDPVVYDLPPAPKEEDGLQ